MGSTPTIRNTRKVTTSCSQIPYSIIFSPPSLSFADHQLSTHASAVTFPVEAWKVLGICFTSENNPRPQPRWLGAKSRRFEKFGKITNSGPLTKLYPGSRPRGWAGLSALDGCRWTTFSKVSRRKKEARAWSLQAAGSGSPDNDWNGEMLCQVLKLSGLGAWTRLFVMRRSWFIIHANYALWLSPPPSFAHRHQTVLARSARPVYLKHSYWLAILPNSVGAIY